MVGEGREHPKGGHGTSPEGARLRILSDLEMTKCGARGHLELEVDTVSSPWEHFASEGRRKMEFARREQGGGCGERTSHLGGQREDLALV